MNYSQKYHPMDEVTRPKRAQRVTGLRSLSASATHHETETSDEEEPELCSGESSDTDDKIDDVETPTERIPDPRAVRHSARAEAKKPVNYSKKHHPQDDAIPGFGRRTKRKRRSARADKPAKKKIQVQTTVDKPIVLSSERVVDSDSDDNDHESDRPQVIHTSPSTASSRRQHLGSPERRLVASNEDSGSPSDHELQTGLPQGESSFNEADNIIQGKHIAQSQRTKQASNELPDAGDKITDSPDINFDDVSTKAIGATMKTIFDNIETPDITDVDPASDEHDEFDEPNIKPPQATAPVALVTPVSEGTSDVSSQPCTQAKTQLTINRPYLATQPEATQESAKLEPSSDRPSESTQADLSSQPASAAAEGKDVLQTEQANRGSYVEALRQVLSDNFEQAARFARAKEVTNRLCSDPTFPGHNTLGSSCKGSNDASRQMSRDTLPDLPDDPSSNHFEEALAVTLDASKSDNDDDFFVPSPYGYSQLPVSDRERSDVCVPQGRSSQKVATSDADNHEHDLSSKTAGSSLLQGDVEIGANQKQGQASDALPSFIDQPQQASPVPSSEDSDLLKPSSM